MNNGYELICCFFQASFTTVHHEISDNCMATVKWKDLQSDLY